MKNYTYIFLTILSTFSLNSFAQATDSFLNEKKIIKAQTLSKTTSEANTISDQTIISYSVQENINMQFGGYTTTYDVSDISLISRNDLGPNNTRIVTANYANGTQLTNYNSKSLVETLNKSNTIVADISKHNEEYSPVDVLETHQMVSDKKFNLNAIVTKKIEILTPDLAKVSELKKGQTETVDNTIKPKVDSSKLDIVDNSNKDDKYIYIDILKTYEKVLEKGYKSIDMFQKIGNAYYFNSELEKAAKWYTKLFAMTTDLKPVYYYRYAQSLKSIGQNAKALTLMEKFDLINNKAMDSSKKQ